MTSRNWLITGVSSGFGRELATQLLDRGDTVVGTVRRPDSVADLLQKYPDTFHRELLDVTDADAVREVVDRSFRSLGRIDVVVSNAGYGLFGAAEELSDEQVGQIIATNLSGSIQHPRLAAAPARPGQRSDHPDLQLRRTGRVPRQLAVPRHQVGHRGLRRVRRPRVAMLDPANGLAVGDPTRMAAAIIASADQQPAPLRLILGSQALQTTVAVLEERIAGFEAQAALAASTDFPPGE